MTMKTHLRRKQIKKHKLLPQKKSTAEPDETHSKSEKMRKKNL